MQTKLFEVRDKGTLIVVMASQAVGETDQENWLLRRMGYGAPAPDMVIMTGLVSHPDKSTYSPYDWGNRTRQVAHQYIIDHWDSLETGAVIDVEFILEETTEPKQSERMGTDP